MFARQLSTIIDQEKLAPVRVQVVNKPGGGSTTAAAYLVSKKGDPHAIACWVNIWLLDPLVQQAATNRLHDMSPIARLVVEPALVVVLADSPYKSLGQFIEAAKANPGKLRWSGGSITSRENTVRQLLMQKTGARWQFISFPSGGERLAALLGGHVEMMIVDPSEAGEQIRAGKFRAIAQVSDRRLPGFPDIPTIKEAGFDIPNVPQMRGIVGSPGMSARSGRLLRGPVLPGEPEPGVEEVRRGEPARRRVRAVEGAQAVPDQLRRHAAGDSEGRGREAGAVAGSRALRSPLVPSPLAGEGSREFTNTIG